MIKNEDITASTRYTECTSYNWHHNIPQADLKLRLGSWVVCSAGCLFKVIGQTPDRWIIQGQSKYEDLIIFQVKKDDMEFLPRRSLAILAPSSKRIDILKQKIMEHPDWNPSIQTYAKSFPEINWAPCIYVSKGTLIKPFKKDQENDK